MSRLFAIYSRKSRFTGKGESVENQVEMCRQYIRAHYSPEDAAAAQVYEDEGFSGGTLERPQFKRMMQDAKGGKFAAIVVYRLDRISRNIGDFAKLIEQLGAMDMDFVSIKEQFDTGSPMGRAMMYISSVFSQLERETIAERIRDNMHELAKTGRWLGGNTPTGYESESVQSVTIDGKSKKACKLKIVPEEMALVKIIFEKFLETGSLTQTDAFLLEKRYVTKRGNRFTRFAIRGILTNPVYMVADGDAYRYLTRHGADLFSAQDDFDGKRGIMAYNRTLQQPGRAHQIRPMEEWIVAVGEHEGVIPGAQWVQVQEMLERNRSKSYRKPRSHVALLSGVLVCGGCGDYMRPKLTGRTTPEGEPAYTYRCNTKERSRGQCCAMKNCPGNQLDGQVVAEIRKLGEDSREFVGQLEKARQALAKGQEGFGGELDRVKGLLAENEGKIQNLVDSLAAASGTGAEPYIIKQIDQLHGEGEALRARLGELEGLARPHELADMEFDLLRQMLADFGSTIDSMGVEQKRAAIRTLVKRVVWDGEKAHITLFGHEGPLGEDSK